MLGALTSRVMGLEVEMERGWPIQRKKMGRMVSIGGDGESVLGGDWEIWLRDYAGFAELVEAETV
jgi:hypothetical protein